MSEPAVSVAEYLKHLWQEMLQVADIHTTQSFPALGGDSLAATRMLSEVLRVWGVSITLGEFYRVDTIGKLAALVETRRACLDDPDFDRQVADVVSGEI